MVEIGLRCCCRGRSQCGNEAESPDGKLHLDSRNQGAGSARCYLFSPQTGKKMTERERNKKKKAGGNQFPPPAANSLRASRTSPPIRRSSGLLTEPRQSFNRANFTSLHSPTQPYSVLRHVRHMKGS